MALVFDHQTHAYALDGKQLPGVSRLISEAGLSDMNWVTEAALLRGEYIHRTIELYLKNDLVEETLDPTLLARLNAFRDFERQTGYRVDRTEDGKPQCEIRLHHPIYGYAGTFDQLGTHDGAALLLELKSGAPAPWHRIQTALYAMFFNARPRRAVLYLPKSGGYRFVQHNDRLDFDVAKAVLTLAAFRRASA